MERVKICMADLAYNFIRRVWLKSFPPVMAALR